MEISKEEAIYIISLTIFVYFIIVMSLLTMMSAICEITNMTKREIFIINLLSVILSVILTLIFIKAVLTNSIILTEIFLFFFKVMLKMIKNSPSTPGEFGGFNHL